MEGGVRVWVLRGKVGVVEKVDCESYEGSEEVGCEGCTEEVGCEGSEEVGCEGCAEEVGCEGSEEVGCEGSEEVGCEDYKRGVEKEDCVEMAIW